MPRTSLAISSFSHTMPWRATNRIADPFQDGGGDSGECVVRRHLNPQLVGGRQLLRCGLDPAPQDLGRTGVLYFPYAMAHLSGSVSLSLLYLGTASSIAPSRRFSSLRRGREQWERWQAGGSRGHVLARHEADGSVRGHTPAVETNRCPNAFTSGARRIPTSRPPLPLGQNHLPFPLPAGEEEEGGEVIRKVQEEIKAVG